MTHAVILHVTQDGHERVLVFRTVHDAYECVVRMARKLFPDDPTVFIEAYDYVANEICERILIGEGLLVPTAWNETKSWKASLAKTRMIDDPHTIFP